MSKREETSFAMGYDTDIDNYPVLHSPLVFYYQYRIGALKRMLYLGRIDINTEVSKLVYHLSMMR